MGDDKGLRDRRDRAFLARLSPVGDCLVWQGSDNGNGYSQMSIGGVRAYVHRYAWERENGPIPEGMMVDHLCYNRGCCNVDHLRLASPSENTQNRSGALGRTGARNVYPNRNGYRVRMMKDGVDYTFGTYSTVEEAALVAERAREELFGEFSGRGRVA